jgi:hypothetical protein
MAKRQGAELRRLASFRLGATALALVRAVPAGRRSAWIDRAIVRYARTREAQAPR